MITTTTTTSNSAAAAPLRRGKGQRRKFRLRAQQQQQQEQEEDSDGHEAAPAPAAAAADLEEKETAVNLRLRARGLDKRVTGLPGNTHLLPLQSMLVLRLSQRAAFYSAYQECVENLHSLAVSSVVGRGNKTNFTKAILKRVPLDVDVVLWKHDGKIVREEIWKNKHVATLARAKRVHARAAGAAAGAGATDDDIELSDTERPLFIRRFGDRAAYGEAAAAAAAAPVLHFQKEEHVGAAFATPTTYVKAVFESVIFALAVDVNSWYYHAMRMISGYFVPKTNEVVDPDPAEAVRWTNRKLRELLLNTEDLPGVIDLLCARTDVFPTVLVFAKRTTPATTTATTTTTTTTPANVFGQLSALPAFRASGATNPDLTLVHDEHGKIVGVHFNYSWLEPFEQPAACGAAAAAAAAAAEGATL